MPDNVLNVAGQLFSVVAGIVALLGGALALAVRHRMKVHAGSAGHRPEGEDADYERVGPDGYIDSFSGSVGEAGGSLPVVAKVIFAVVAVSYFAYLILFWQPR
jgi:hypothetical protein